MKRAARSPRKSAELQAEDTGLPVIALTSYGLEALAQQEIAELLGVPAQRDSSHVSFSVGKKEDLLFLAFHAQSVRRLLLPFAELQGDQLLFTAAFSWLELFPKEFLCRMDVENVKGAENRMAVAKKATQALFAALEKEDYTPMLQYRRPDIVLRVYFTGEKYLLCLDPCGRDLNARDYRVFAHQAGFKGDLGYFFVRTSGFKRGENLGIGFARDGVLAIEAALYAFRRPVHDAERVGFLFKNSPFFNGVVLPERPAETGAVIHTFDSSLPNVKAAKKNARLAKVDDAIRSTKCQLEDLELRSGSQAFDRLIFHITSKDEDKLNELYYQSKALLKSCGTVLFISRDTWDPAISSDFTLHSRDLFKRGDSALQWLVLEKK